VKVLITGGAGFIGSNLTDRLLPYGITTQNAYKESDRPKIHAYPAAHVYADRLLCGIEHCVSGMLREFGAK